MNDENKIADVPSEGDSLDIDKSFERLSKKTEGDKTSTESQPEKKETEKSPSQKGEPEKDNSSDAQMPFHKHPRWIKTQEQLKNYEAKIAEFEGKFKEVEKGKVSEVLPKWWEDRYGKDEVSQKSYKDYQVATQAERDRIKDEVKQDILKDTQDKTSQENAGEKYVEEQTAEMLEEGLKFEKNELLKFMVDYQNEFGSAGLLDDKGNYDFRKSLKLMEKMSPKVPDNSIEAKKRVAADTVRSKTKVSTTSGIPVISRKALRGSWRDAGI